VLAEPAWTGRRRVLIFSASADKDVRTMLQLILPHFHHAVLTRFLGNPRSVPPDQLLQLARSLDPERTHCTVLSTAGEPSAALDAARSLAGPEGLICVTGSLFLAAETRGLLARHRFRN
jgi:dihydrofolate synthase / folylpolyglutamate synthase